MIRECVVCGAEFDARGPKKTCSKHCAHELDRVRKEKWHQVKQKLLLSDKPCAYCGVKGNLKPKHRFCSKSCHDAHRANRVRRAGDAKCVECGSEFTQNKADRTTCSTKCLRKRRARRCFENPAGAIKHELKRQLGTEPPADLVEEATALRLLNRALRS